MKNFISAIWLLLTLRCKHSSHLISSGMDDEWSGVERWAVWLHYISCRSCRRLRRQVEFVSQAARSLESVFSNSPDLRLSAQARSRLARDLRRATDDRAT